MIFRDEGIKKTIIRQRIEVYQRPNVKYYRDRVPKYRRIASLPNADDETLDFLQRKYPKPEFNVRVVTELF